MYTVKTHTIYNYVTKYIVANTNFSHLLNKSLAINATICILCTVQTYVRMYVYVL